MKAYLWSEDQSSLIKVKQDIPKLTGSAIVLDWHQVLDTDRQTSRNVQWVGPDGQIPWRHRATLLELGHLCRESVRVVHLLICSHIETSSRNLENVIHATEQSGLPVQLVLITTQRTGPQGKLAALRAAISGSFCLFDDNTEIIEEFTGASRPIAQVLRPRARRSTLLPNNCIGWSISSEPLHSIAKQFVKYFSRSSACFCLAAVRLRQRLGRSTVLRSFRGILLFANLQGLGILLSTAVIHMLCFSQTITTNW